LFVQHGVDVAFVNFNDEEILDEQCVKELEEEIMSVVEQAFAQPVIIWYYHCTGRQFSRLGMTK